MDSMWLEVILNVKAEEMDALCATLIANGVPGLAVEEEEEFRLSWRKTGSIGTMWTTSSWSR